MYILIQLFCLINTLFSYATINNNFIKKSLVTKILKNNYIHFCHFNVDHLMEQ